MLKAQNISLKNLLNCKTEYCFIIITIVITKAVFKQLFKDILQEG